MNTSDLKGSNLSVSKWNGEKDWKGFFLTPDVAGGMMKTSSE
jgi:hypothetical protein